MKIYTPISASLILIVALGTASAQSSLDRLKGTVDTTTKQSDVCPAHGVRMAKRQVEITYGLPPASSPQPAREVRAHKFPFGEPLYLGGCVVSDDSPKYALVYVCPQCELAAKKWFQAHTKR